MTVFAGWVIDRIGTKLGLALSLIVWSVFGIVNAFVGRLLVMHIMVRSAVRRRRSGQLSRLHQDRRRMVSQARTRPGHGHFQQRLEFRRDGGGARGPWCMIHFGDQQGWKMAFILTGALGFFWLIFWFWLYDPPAKQPRLSKAEYDYIHIDDEVAAEAQAGDKGKVPWLTALWLSPALGVLCRANS